MDVLLRDLRNKLMFKLRRKNKRECLELVKAGFFELEYFNRSYVYEESILNLRVNRVIYEKLNEAVNDLRLVLKNEFLDEKLENIIIIDTDIIPIYETFVDWDAIRGVETKSSLISKINYEKDIMLSYVGLDSKIPEENYIELHQHLINIFSRIGVDYAHDIKTFAEMYDYLINVARDKGAWAARRNHIENLYAPIIEILSESYDDETEVGSSYVPTGWPLIDKNINLMLANFNDASKPVEFVGVGNMLRDILLESAKIVYNDKLHHPADFSGVVSSSDYPRMLYGYFEYKYSGRSNKQYRDISKKTTDLAHKVTHSCDTKKKLSIAVESTLFLVRLLKLSDEN